METLRVAVHLDNDALPDLLAFRYCCETYQPVGPQGCENSECGVIMKKSRARWTAFEELTED
jgi:hypothetical protein